MTKRVLAMAGMMLLAVGCGSSSTPRAGGGITYTLVPDDLTYDIPPGACQLVEGPFNLPAGAVNDFTVDDKPDDLDSMSVAIVFNGDPVDCDLTGAYDDSYGYTSGQGTVTISTGPVVGGGYDFWIRCNNSLSLGDCLPGLLWTATY